MQSTTTEFHPLEVGQTTVEVDLVLVQRAQELGCTTDLINAIRAALDRIVADDGPQCPFEFSVLRFGTGTPPSLMLERLTEGKGFRVQWLKEFPLDGVGIYVYASLMRRLQPSMPQMRAQLLPAVRTWPDGEKVFSFAGIDVTLVEKGDDGFNLVEIR